MKHNRLLYYVTLCIGIVSCSTITYGQNTIGSTLNTADALNGYTLVTPNANTIPNKTYLLNNCGEIVNEWTSNFKGQGADLILEDGSLFRAAFDDQSTLVYPGNTGRLEKYDWDGNLLWGFTYSDTDFSFHHDYFPLSNGNILLIVAERMTNAQAIQAGRDPALLTAQGDLYNEKIIEIEPQGTDSATIVWEWSLWDHLIQDFDPTKDNFGIVEDNPGAIDINFIGFSNNNADWTHLNAIDYNETLDQIVISARFTSEFYIIDHSTTTQEASTNSGGNSNLGGSFMYRWGNPQAYNRGVPADQKLFGQHSVHWVEEGLPNADKIMVFNNGFTRGYTTVEFIDPPLNSSNTYDLAQNTSYDPVNGEIAYEDPNNQTDFFAPFLSSAYQLENGNILINNGPIGQLFEVDPLANTVWEYISPVRLDGSLLSQGDDPALINSRFFRGRKYPTDYQGFAGRDLTPNGYVEQNAMPANCNILSIDEFSINENVKIYPTIVSNSLNIQTSFNNFNVLVLDMMGREINSYENVNTIDVSYLKSGTYFVQFKTDTKSKTTKLIKQ